MKKVLPGRRLLLLVAAVVLIFGALALAGCSCSSQESKSSSASAASSSSAAEDVMYTVPNVVSLTQADAKKAILASGLQVGTIKNEPSDKVPRGSVISQSPEGLTNAKANSKVDLVVSTGKAESKDVAVPDLKGKTQHDAEKALSDVGLVGVASNPEETDEVQPGQVFKQSIAAGTTVKEGTKIAFTVALAPAEATVPNVVGMTRDDAKKAITDAKLGFDSATSYNDTVPEGNVISQSLDAGKKVKQGTTVSVNVSLGPKPVENVTVPDVMSNSWADAENALHSAGLAARYTGDPAGVVTAQDVAAGTKVAPNTLVTVTLASPVVYVTVPDLVGMTVSAAEDATDQVGLALDVDGGYDGTVVSQWPEAGEQVEAHSTVSVTVEAPEPTWKSAGSASEAAKGAGIGSFSVMDSVTIGDNTFTKPSFSYMSGIAQAIYDAPACRVVIRKGYGPAGTVIPGELPSFSQQWSQNFKGLNITCNGNAQDKATYIEWYVDEEAYSAYYEGLGGETMTMSPDDVSSIVAGIQ